jgi:hypothetical protein
MPLNVHDELTDILKVIDDEQIAALRDDLIRIYYAPEPRGYDFHVRELTGPLPPLDGIILQSGPEYRPGLIHTARLSREAHPAWPVYSFGIPLYAEPSDGSHHTWPIRLINDQDGLLHNQDAEYCLPHEGIELDFDALFSGDLETG